MLNTDQGTLECIGQIRPRDLKEAKTAINEFLDDLMIEAATKDISNRKWTEFTKMFNRS